jgi:hypothetical protein
MERKNIQRRGSAVGANVGVLCVFQNNDFLQDFSHRDRLPREARW